MLPDGCECEESLVGSVQAQVSCRKLTMWRLITVTPSASSMGLEGQTWRSWVHTKLQPLHSSTGMICPWCRCMHGCYQIQKGVLWIPDAVDVTHHEAARFMSSETMMTLENLWLMPLRPHQGIYLSYGPAAYESWKIEMKIILENLCIIPATLPRMSLSSPSLVVQCHSVFKLSVRSASWWVTGEHEGLRCASLPANFSEILLFLFCQHHLDKSWMCP